MQSHTLKRPAKAKKVSSSLPAHTAKRSTINKKTKQHFSTSTTSSIDTNLDTISKHIPPQLSTPSYKGSILNKHHANNESTAESPTLANVKQSTASLYDELLFDKHTHVSLNPNTLNTSYENYQIDEELYDANTASALKHQIVKKPIEQMKPLINALLPKDAILDQFSYLRIRKIAKSNPDLLQMDENKLHQRLQQLSKIVLHPKFYKEYTKRYVFTKHEISPHVPEYSSLTPEILSYLETKKQNLQQGINQPDPQKELHLRSYKKLHQYPYNPLVLHVFERHPLILRRKHIENTPQLIFQIFSNLAGVESLFENMNEFNDNVVPAQDDPEFAHKSPFHITWDESTGKNQQTEQQSENHQIAKSIDPFAILGRFPKLLQFDLNNRIHHKVDSFTTVLCTFLAQDHNLHDGIYTRDDISKAREHVLSILVQQPDILQANIYNTIPKRLDFIQKACLFNTAEDTLKFVLENPRILTIPPSSLQRLSLLRLKPPRFIHVNEDQWAKLGFEQRFAVEMIQKLAQLTPYPSLSQNIVQNMKHGKKVNATNSLTMDEYNQQEALYESYDLSWAEYLESAAPASKYDTDRPKMGLKAQIIPLLTLMHTKTFNTIFGEFVDAKKRNNISLGKYQPPQLQKKHQPGKDATHRDIDQDTRFDAFLGTSIADNEELQSYEAANDEEYDLIATYAPTSHPSTKKKPIADDLIDSILTADIQLDSSSNTSSINNHTANDGSSNQDGVRITSAAIAEAEQDGDDLHFKNSGHHAPARELHLQGKNSTQSFASLNPDHNNMFYKSDLKVSARDQSKDKLHKFKGKGGQFGTQSAALAFQGDDPVAVEYQQMLSTEGAGSFGLKIRKKMLNEAQSGSESQYDSPEEAIDEKLSLAQQKFIHKNKLQKVVVQKKRVQGQHAEEDFMNELHYHYGDDDDELFESVVPNSGYVDGQTRKQVRASQVPPLDALSSIRAPPYYELNGKNNDKPEDLALYDVDFDLDAALDETSLGQQEPRISAATTATTTTTTTGVVEEKKSQIDEKHGKKTASTRPKGSGRRAPPLDSFETKWSGGSRGGKTLL